MSMQARNVNEAFSRLRNMMVSGRGNWREISPRGMRTLEWKGVFCTEYWRPCERVLFDPVRDANPFFHFFEALWILAGRSDVAFLQYFNSNIASFSDDGKKFHGAYGYRLRQYFNGEERDEIDQVAKAIELLNADLDTRQVVLSIWDVGLDLGRKTKDLPCNDLLMLKIRDGKLNLTVCCRSNDAVWGAYGANVVQFSTLQEFIARAVGVEVGIYTQVSDSFHVYLDRPDFEKNFGASALFTNHDLYFGGVAKPFPLINEGTSWKEWLTQCEHFCDRGALFENADPYFKIVAAPMLTAWRLHKSNATETAISHIAAEMTPCDWKIACTRWLERRLKQ